MLMSVTTFCFFIVFCHSTELRKDRHLQLGRYISSVSAEPDSILNVVFTLSPSASGTEDYEVTAIASTNVSAGGIVALIPPTFTFGMEDVDRRISFIGEKFGCNIQVPLAMGLLQSSKLAEWKELIPEKSINVFYFNAEEIRVIRNSLFSFMIDSWYVDLDCMRRAADDVPLDVWGTKPSMADLKWALSAVKSRGFPVPGDSDRSIIVPIADFIGHSGMPNVFQSPGHPSVFIASRDIAEGEVVVIEYAKTSSLELLLRFGFWDPTSFYSGRQFDLMGEEVQSQCPPVLLLKNNVDVVPSSTVDCHRQARHIRCDLAVRSFVKERVTFNPQVKR